MKHCIWCKKTEIDVDFKHKAHTIPQSLGGKQICENVCDKCNHFFGEYSHGLPSIETVIKEAFNISRIILLHGYGEVGKNKIVPKNASVYYDINIKNWTIKPKTAYKFLPSFQQKLGRQLKKAF